ncbi:hypothetical protein RSK20926_00385 [Roseobacter sp. SK209-2-6]|nr:hypothetical protein RSK20926_00385 [Roseobacter sp. SK209-2-6]
MLRSGYLEECLSFLKQTRGNAQRRAWLRAELAEAKRSEVSTARRLAEVLGRRIRKRDREYCKQLVETRRIFFLEPAEPKKGQNPSSLRMSHLRYARLCSQDLRAAISTVLYSIRNSGRNESSRKPRERLKEEILALVPPAKSLLRRMQLARAELTKAREGIQQLQNALQACQQARVSVAEAETCHRLQTNLEAMTLILDRYEHSLGPELDEFCHEGNLSDFAQDLVKGQQTQDLKPKAWKVIGAGLCGMGATAMLLAGPDKLSQYGQLAGWGAVSVFAALFFAVLCKMRFFHNGQTQLRQRRLAALTALFELPALEGATSDVGRQILHLKALRWRHLRELPSLMSLQREPMSFDFPRFDLYQVSSPSGAFAGSGAMSGAMPVLCATGERARGKSNAALQIPPPQAPHRFAAVSSFAENALCPEKTLKEPPIEMKESS